MGEGCGDVFSGGLGVGGGGGRGKNKDWLEPIKNGYIIDNYKPTMSFSRSSLIISNL